MQANPRRTHTVSLKPRGNFEILCPRPKHPRATAPPKLARLLLLAMGIAKKTRKFAQVKRIIGQRDARL